MTLRIFTVPRISEIAIETIGDHFQECFESENSREKVIDNIERVSIALRHLKVRHHQRNYVQQNTRHNKVL